MKYIYIYIKTNYMKTAFVMKKLFFIFFYIFRLKLLLLCSKDIEIL